jgi:hypothetical protein
MADLKVYRRGETPKIYANVYAETMDAYGVLQQGALTSPTTMQVIIEDSTGDVVQALANMYEDATGKFTYGVGTTYYTIPVTANAGIWHYDIVATTSSIVTKARGAFEVIEEVV